MMPSHVATRVEGQSYVEGLASARGTPVKDVMPEPEQRLAAVSLVVI